MKDVVDYLGTVSNQSLSLPSIRSAEFPTQQNPNPRDGEMYVVKRDGMQESVHFDKITARLKKLSYGLNPEHCDPCSSPRRSASESTRASPPASSTAETAAAMTAKSNHSDYATLAARIVVSNLHKNTKKSFSETIKDMYNHFNGRSGLKAPLVSDDVYEIIMKNGARVDSAIIYDKRL